MSSGSPSGMGLSDGPNKKSRLLELIQLPESLDDAVLQPASATTTQQHLPADEAQRQLGTLQLGTRDDMGSPRLAAAALILEADAPAPPPAPSTDTLMATEPDILATNATAAAPETSALAANPRAGTVPEAAAAGADKLPIGPSGQREVSPEPAASDQGVCISYDLVVDSSALEGLGGDEGEGEVASRRTALAGSNGAGGGRIGGFEVFIGGLAPHTREEDLRAALVEVAGSEVLSVRLQLTRGTSVCKGYGFATFADEAAAQRAVSAAAGGANLCGRRVGLHASRRPFRAVLASAQAAGAQLPLQPCSEAGASINGLLEIMRQHPDRRAAVAATLRVVQRGAKRAYPTLNSAASPPVLADNASSGAAVAVTAAAGPAQRTTTEAKRQATAANVALAATSVTVKIEVPDSNPPPDGGCGQGATTMDNGTSVISAAVEAAAPTAAHASAPASTDEAAEAKKEGPTTKKESQAGTPAVTPGSGAATSGTGPKKGSGEKAGGSSGGGASGSGAAAAAGGMSQDLVAALAAYPKIANLLGTLKDTRRVAKTPVMVLHEYATKMSYEVSYLETSDGPAGPYMVESRLMSVGPKRITVATASGKARTKKDAKQVSAAALLEKLLDGPRGLSPQDLLPVPKPPLGMGGNSRSAGGKAGSEKSRGSQGNASANPRKGSSSRPSGPQAGGFPLPAHSAHFNGRDTLNKGVVPPLKLLPPPPPPPSLFHGSLMSNRGGAPMYSGGAGSLGPIGRGPFGTGTGSSNYSSVQPGLNPANQSLLASGGGLGHLSNGGGGGVSGTFGGLSDNRGSASRMQRSGPESYDGQSYGDIRHASGSRGGGGGGSMVQLGLSSSNKSIGGMSSTKYGGLYGRDDDPSGNGMGLDSQGGSSSYDIAAGQKRNYSTAMQAAYGAPAASQGLLPVQPPQQPAAGAVGSMLGGGGGGRQDPFAAQAGGGSRGLGGGNGVSAGLGVVQQFPSFQPQQQSLVLGQMQTQSTAFARPHQQQPVGESVYGNTSQMQSGSMTQQVFGQIQQQQHLGTLSSPADAGASSVQHTFGGFGPGQGTQQQQTLHLGYAQQSVGVMASGTNAPSGVSVLGGLYNNGQTVQLQTIQPQPLYAQPATQPVTQTNAYSMTASYAQPPAKQTQQPYVSSGIYGGMPQNTQNSAYAGSSILQQQQQPQAGSHSYGMPSTAGLQGYGGVRPGAGLWG